MTSLNVKRKIRHQLSDQLSSLDPDELRELIFVLVEKECEGVEEINSRYILLDRAITRVQECIDQVLSNTKKRDENCQ
jgi:hypothetical protein